MTERIDHASQAMDLLDLSRHPATGDPTIGALYVGAAQVHATLALAEQQRIANLIAYVAQWNAQYVADEAQPGLFNEDTYEESLLRREHASALMREGLGL